MTDFLLTMTLVHILINHCYVETTHQKLFMFCLASNFNDDILYKRIF